MQLSGIDLSAYMRLTQPDDALDIEIELLKTGVAEIKPSLYTLLFFDLMNGVLTGADDPGNSITTGIWFDVKLVDGTSLAQTTKAKLDWYESTTYYIVEAVSIANVTLSADVKISNVDVYFTANDVSAGSEKNILLATSAAPANCAFSSSDENGSGIVVQNANGNLTIACRYVVHITK